jgi:hypothetical protein
MKTISVEASEITPTLIKFICPQCWSKYKKNGDPYKRAKRVMHIHGNETQSKNNRTTDRGPHCIVNNNDIDSFDIHITEKTIRKGF